MSEMIAKILEFFPQEDEFYLCLLTKEQNIIDEINAKIKISEGNKPLKIIIPSAFLKEGKKNSANIKYKNGNFIDYSAISETKDINFRVILFADFESSYQLYGTSASYKNLIQDSSFLRKCCSKIFLYRYPNSHITCGYWKFAEQIGNDCVLLELGDWGRIVQRLPKPPKNAISIVEVSSNERQRSFIESLKNFLLEFMTLVFEDESDRAMVDTILDIFKTDSSVSQLIVAFTHPSVSDLNYENSEHRGDRLSISLLSEAMHTKFPNLTPSEASSYALYYSSAVSQKIFSKDLKLIERMIKPTFISSETLLEEDIDNLHSDIFESFLGCIAKISSNLFSGAQLMISFKIMSLIAESLTFDRSLIRGDSKKQVIQLLEMYDSALKESIELVNAGDYFYFNISPELSQFLDIKKKEGNGRAFSDEIKNKRFPIKQGKKGLKGISSEAWDLVLNQLRSIGVTYENLMTTEYDSLKFLNKFEKGNRETSIYERLGDRLVEKYTGEKSNLLKRIYFTIKKKENYISMGLRMYNFDTKESYYHKGAILPVIDYQREENNYSEVLNIILDNSKLACVPFPSEDFIIGMEGEENWGEMKASGITPTKYGQFLAVQQFLGIS